MRENKKIRELYKIYTQLLFSNINLFLGSDNFLVSFSKGKKIFVHQPYYFPWLIFFKTSLIPISLTFLLKFNAAAHLFLKCISFRLLYTTSIFQ